MPHTLKHQRLVVSLTVVVLGLGAAGCGDSNDTESSTPPSTGTSEPAVTESGAKTASASADPSASGDWWPEEPKTMATGQEIPEDYQPATLEHPARNVPKPVMPEQATQETEAGAQAFLNYRTDAVWYAFQTGDTALAREVTSNSCERCLDQFNRIDVIYSDGGWIAGGYEGGDILENGFIQGPDGVYTIPVETNSFGVKVIEENRLASQQNPFNTDEGFNVNIIYKDKKWLYVTASPQNS